MANLTSLLQGGIILTKYLSEADTGLYDPPSNSSTFASAPAFRGSGLVAAAVVSSPICLWNSMANLSKPWTLTYLYNLAVAYK